MPCRKAQGRTSEAPEVARVTGRDIVVFIPLIPALPVIVTWWLPWERWVPKWIPMYVVGPYLLYAAFAEWYFDLPWWSVGLVAIGGVAACGKAISDALAKEDEK